MNQAQANKPRHLQVASYKHSLVFLCIVLLVMVFGYAAQHRQGDSSSLVEKPVHLVPMYLSVALMNWMLVLFSWRGICKAGGIFFAVIGGRWANIRDLVRDLAIAAMFWGVMTLVALVMGILLGHGQEKTLGNLMPQTILEVLAWAFTSFSAGFCEEFVFRGYLLRQLLALSQRTWAAICGQAFIFALMHSYQGWRPVVLIFVIGLLFGSLAVWRQTLRVGMIAHGWQDFWAGWLSRFF